MNLRRATELVLVTPPQTAESLERITAARDLLIGEFTLAQTAVTGRSVACVIESHDGLLYAGHNIEKQSPVQFAHAEPMAIQNFLHRSGSDSISRIYMAGSDPAATGQKIRDICPCSDCYEALSPHISDDTQLVLFEPNTLDEVLVFDAHEFIDAYRPREFSEITAIEVDGIKKQLAERTDLNHADQVLAAGLRIAGLRNGINFYLTGSASGRGWMSNAIHRKRGTYYDDLDIVAVATAVSEQTVQRIVLKSIESSARQYVTYDETIADIWNVSGANKATQRRIRYNSFFAKDRKILDLLIASTLEEGMLRADYRKNNFFHKLS